MLYRVRATGRHLEYWVEVDCRVRGFVVGAWCSARRGLQRRVGHLGRHGRCGPPDTSPAFRGVQRVRDAGHDVPAHSTGTLAWRRLASPDDVPVVDAPFGAESAGPDSVVTLERLEPGEAYVVQLTSASDLAFYVATGCSTPAGPDATSACCSRTRPSAARSERFVATTPTAYVVVDYYAANSPRRQDFTLDVYASSASTRAPVRRRDAGMSRAAAASRARRASTARHAAAPRCDSPPTAARPASIVHGRRHRRAIQRRPRRRDGDHARRRRPQRRSARRSVRARATSSTTTSSSSIRSARTGTFGLAWSGTATSISRCSTERARRSASRSGSSPSP